MNEREDKMTRKQAEGLLRRIERLCAETLKGGLDGLAMSVGDEIQKVCGKLPIKVR